MTVIPLTTDKNQSFRATLEGRNFRFEVSYNSRSKVWEMDMRGIEDPTVAVNGVNLVTGTDLLKQYNLSLGSLLMLNADDSLLDATADNLGASVVLALLTEAEKQGLLNG